MNETVYSMDVVACIDRGNDMLCKSESVAASIKGIIDSLQNIYDMECAWPNERMNLRLKLIAYGGDSPDQISETDFLNPSEDRESIQSFLDNLVYSGLAGNPMVALDRAINSDWNRVNITRTRHLVLFYSRGDESNYSPSVKEKISSERERLYPIWEVGSEAATKSFTASRGRMVIFSDGTFPWEDIWMWSRVFYSEEIFEDTKELDNLADAIL